MACGSFQKVKNVLITNFDTASNSFCSQICYKEYGKYFGFALPDGVKM